MPDELSSPIPILREESHFLLVNKPAGLFSQAAAGVDSLEVQLAMQLKRRDAHPGQPFIGLPHRLDRGTSGVMLIAKNQRALKRFGAQFQSRKVNKVYVAVVELNAGSQAAFEALSVAGDTHAVPIVWEDYVRKIADQPRAEVVTADAAGAKLARLRTLRVGEAQWNETQAGQDAGLGLLLIQLETGRMHQIRVQAAARRMPLLGDRNYGATCPFALADQQPNSDSHPPVALHALRLEFRHPQSAKMISATADVPRTWDALPSSLRARIAALTEGSRRAADASWNWRALGQ